MGVCVLLHNEMPFDDKIADDRWESNKSNYVGDKMALREY